MAIYPNDATDMPWVEITVAGGETITIERISSFEWKSMMNNGYIIKCGINDPYLNILDNLFVDNKLLPKFREDATPVTFKIGWSGDNGPVSDQFLGYLIEVRARGESADDNITEILAIDPPSWRLNAGKGDGKVYTGKVSDVIKQVVNEYAGEVSVEVSETEDNPKGKWAMMRQDPKTFIKSLLDWSSSIAKNKKASWIIASDGNTAAQPKIIIKTQADLTPNDWGIVECMALDADQGAMLGYHFLSDATITAYQSRLITQGISAVSGQYMDQNSLPKETIMDDDRSFPKYNAKIKADQGYAKPTKKYATSIRSIPELNGREMGLNYKDYIDGRARERFVNMLSNVMRIKVTTVGNPAAVRSVDLGVSTVNLKWVGTDENKFFLNGNWMIYGFHHRISSGRADFLGTFETDLYLYRFDYNANAIPIP